MRYNREYTLGEVLVQWMKTMRMEPKVQEQRVIALWHEQMGPMISRYTHSVKVVKGVLYVQVASSPLRAELTHNREKIKQLINKELGVDYIQQVVIR